MPIGAAPEFRPVALQGAPARQAENFAVSYAASLAINAIFIMLMIWEIGARVEFAGGSGNACRNHRRSAAAGRRSASRDGSRPAAARRREGQVERGMASEDRR